MAHYSEKVCWSEPRHLLVTTTSHVGAGALTRPARGNAGQFRSGTSLASYARLPGRGRPGLRGSGGSDWFRQKFAGDQKRRLQKQNKLGRSCATSLPGQFMEMPYRHCFSAIPVFSCRGRARPDGR